MISIQQIRDSLPPKYKSLPDEEVAKLRDTMYGLANVFFDMWLKKKNEKKNKEKETKK